MSLRLGVLATFALGISSVVTADPLSRNLAIDFFRDVPSRNLKGLATRSDGRLVAGPVFTDLNAAPMADLLWCLESGADGKWLVGTGPDGKIFELTLDLAKAGFTSREVANLDEPQVFALKRLPDGALLAGTSPNGAVLLVRDGKVAARVALPVDSIFDFVAVDPRTLLVGTGNPGRVYRIDLGKFTGAGINAEKISDEKALAAKGITLLGEVHDRNVRRLALLGDRVIAGSSPKGNIYSFSAAGGVSTLLQENKDAEVAALLPQANGDLYAAIVFANTPGESRINRGSPGKSTGDVPPGDTPPPPPPTAVERFSGRSTVVYFPKNGFPETIVGRSGIAFYALARRGDTLLIAGGEQGDLVGFDLKSRQSLSFAGSASSQINQLVPLPAKAVNGGEAPAQFLALRNNAPGLALIDFNATGQREAETRRLDLNTPATLGAVRFSGLHGAEPPQVLVDVRTSLAADEAEGWSAWRPAGLRDDGWLATDCRGRYVKVRVALKSGAAPTVQLDRASLFYLPQNRRPQLADFRLISPNYAMLPQPDMPSSPITTLGQLVGPERDRGEDKRKSGLLGSTIVPQPGSQIVLWTVTDPDGDNLAYTFSICREGSNTWTDLAVGTREPYVQFDISHMDDGVYLTRLTVTEQAPRPVDDRLSVSFATEDLVVDKTPPVLGDVKVSRDKENLILSVSGRDALSLLDSTDFVFNNGYHEEISQPADGIRDSQAETFVLTVPLDKVLGATSVEILLYDAVGNSVAKRVNL